MTAFRSAFDSAGFPQKAGLPGEWWMIQMVSAPSRMPELIEFDPSGYKRDDIDGRPLEWRLVFGTESTGELTLTSYHPYDPKELQDEVRFAENGELWFTTEFGGDSRITYRCRERRQNRLICLMRGAEDYDGREFLKVR